MEKYSKRELKIGSKIELEHTNSKRIATKIAKDHLREYPNYYTKGLLPMEKKLERLKEDREYKGKCMGKRKKMIIPNFEKQAREYIKI